jgi:hypothetical protein
MLQNQINGNIDSYIMQARSLLSQAKQLREQSKARGTDPVIRLLSEVGGAVGRDILGSGAGRRIGKSLTRGFLVQQEKQRISLLNDRLETDFALFLNSVKSFLSLISIAKPSLPSTGNSALLVGRLRKVSEGQRIETRIARVIATLEGIKHEQLIYNSDIAKWREETRAREYEGGEPYQTMKKLETGLRQFIQMKLESTSQDWWNERVPEDVRQRAQERKAKNERQYPWENQSETHPIHYIDFADYAKIILRRDNWEQLFSVVFKERDIIATKLKELEPIRNAIAHFRNLRPNQAARLELNVDDIRRSIGSTKPD